MRAKGAIPTQYIFDRAVSRYEKTGSGNYKLFPNALMAAEDLAINASKQKRKTPIDSIALANTITYYADEGDIFYGYIWKWEDGRSNLPVDIFSSAEKNDIRTSLPVVVANDTMERSEPYSPPRKVCCDYCVNCIDARHSCISH